MVLRGEGDGEDGPFFMATARKQQVLVQIGGNRSLREDAKPSVEVVGDYVPVGARSFAGQSAKSFKTGQGVWVVRRGNAAWISEIGMDRIAPRAADPSATKQWTPFDV